MTTWTRTIITTLLLGSVVTFTAVIPAPACAAGVAKVLYALGETSALDKNGISRSLRRGEFVAEGDTLATGKGRLQVRFEDGGYVSLSPNSRFAIETYRYDQVAPARSRSFFRLLKGGIRALTGSIGRTDHARYRVTTAVATIGIRGTTYKALYCNADCAEDDGLYATGGEGTIVMANGEGELELTTGESGYVASETTPPRRVEKRTSIADVPRAGGGLADAASKIEFNGGDAVFQESTVIAASQILPLYQAAVALSGTVELDGKIETGTGIDAASRTVDDNLVALNGGFDASNRLVSIAGTNDEGESGAFTASNAADAATDGVLYLGRWTDGTFTAVADGGYSESSTLGANDSAHYIVGVDDVVVPDAGSATYAFSGLATASTALDGSVGDGITSGQVSVDFGSHLVQTDFRVGHGVDLSVSTSGFIDSGAPTFQTDGSAVGGGPCALSCETNVDGFFAGGGASFPARVGLSYEIEVDADAGPQGAIVGVGGFSLQ